MTVKEKIQQYIDYKCISIYRLEASAELSKGYWAKTKSISADVVMRISRIYTDLSAEWLLRGEGEMLKNNSSGVITHSGTFNSSTIHSQVGNSTVIKSSNKSDEEIIKLKDEIKKLRDEIKKIKDKDKISSTTIDSLNARLVDKDTILIEKERFIQSLLNGK